MARLKNGNYIGTGRAAEIIGCTSNWVCKLLQEGTLSGVKVSQRSWILPEKAAQQYARKTKRTGRPRISQRSD